MHFETKQLCSKIDHLAPDGSEIRLLAQLRSGGLCHCTLPSNGTSIAVSHRTVEEIWYIIEGRGEVWLKEGDQEEVVDACPGLSLTIPVGACFQFQNTGEGPLCIIIATMPPWPGPEEAVDVPGRWLDIVSSASGPVHVRKTPARIDAGNAI